MDINPVPEWRTILRPCFPVGCGAAICPFPPPACQPPPITCLQRDPLGGEVPAVSPMPQALCGRPVTKARWVAGTPWGGGFSQCWDIALPRILCPQSLSSPGLVSTKPRGALGPPGVY